ncbi:tail terminator [Pseudaeromonas phage vB_PpeM_ KLEP7]|nr:tail terminator [Pseudaeromonas phage vB_PpeM_ KLEP7]
MATIEEQKQALLEAFSGLITDATGLDVYLFGQEFTRPAGRYIALNILSSKKNGTNLSDMFDVDGYFSSVVNYDIRVTVTAYRYDAYSPLVSIEMQMLSDSPLYEKYFSGTAFGYLSSTQINRYDAPLDAQTFEERASITFDFNISYLDVAATATEIIEQINITTNINVGDKSETTPPIEDEIITNYP